MANISRDAFLQVRPNASPEVVEWLVKTYETLRTELSYKAFPHDVVRDLLPILAALGFDWPMREEMNIIPRMKRRPDGR